MSSWSPPVTPTPINDLISRYEKDLIVIPEFQRDFVWTLAQIKELIISIYKGYPIGMLIQWETPPELSSSVGRYWLIDGQQRLLSLVAVCKGVVKLRKGKYKSVILRFNPLTEEFQFDSPRIRDDPLWINVKLLVENPLSETVNTLRKSTFLKEDEIRLCEQRLDKLRSNLINYLIPVCTLKPDLEPEDAANIFIKLNSTGTRVKAAELYLATFAIMLPGKIAIEISDFMDDMKRQGWDLDVSVIIRTILAFLAGKVRIANRVLDQARIIKKNYSDSQLQEAWTKAKESINYVINLLGDRWNLYGSDLIPSQTAITTMAFFCGVKNLDIDRSEQDSMLKWFLLATYWGRYSGATETRLNEDIEVIKESTDPWSKLLSKIKNMSGRLIPSNEDYQGAETDKLLLLYVLLKEKDATSLLSTQQLRSDMVQVHHIFPKALLKGDYPEELVEDIANKTFIIGKENLRIGNKEPIEYLWGRVADNVLEAHFIPRHSSLLKKEKFQEFLKERRRLIIEDLNKYFKEIESN
jgi:hypothetical protein